MVPFTYIDMTRRPQKEWDDLVPKPSLYFAVKTCKKFHKDRIPVVQNTWAKHTDKITFSATKKIFSTKL
ncbi:hypothetical protein NQ318_022927 [Aromia moschata]|uniref:Fringe-like glycosyltransferase domain-containing protein n=1 Tax=Aromia moschata TaxID=1265417 RepID=A0AAV8X0D9_9CUCU|nr:hypothetical protein NQ318_022927 [Aromia moschata]